MTGDISGETDVVPPPTEQARALLLPELPAEFRRASRLGLYILLVAMVGLGAIGMGIGAIGMAAWRAHSSAAPPVGAVVPIKGDRAARNAESMSECPSADVVYHRALCVLAGILLGSFLAGVAAGYAGYY